MCTPTTVVASAGHGNTTGSPPRLLTGRAEHRRPRGLHRAGAVSTLDAYYAAAPASTLLLRRNRERRGGLPNPRLHTEVHTNDSNIGTRARLPLCNPNPNRVKAKLQRDRGGGRYCLPVTTATAWGKEAAPFDGARQRTEKIKSSSDLTRKRVLPNSNPNSREKEEEWVRIWPNPKT